MAPVVIGYADHLLREAAKEKNPKIVFVARDGVGSYEVAKILLQRFPQRYEGITEGDLSFLFLNKETMRDPLVDDYVRQAGIKEGDRVYIADLGFFGSLDHSFEKLIGRLGAKYQGMHLVFASGGGKAAGWALNAAGGIHHEGSEVLAQIPGNPFVHWLEDPFSGIHRKPKKLAQRGGEIVPAIPSDGYSGKNLQTRKTNLQGLKDAAGDVSFSALNNTGRKEIVENLFRFASKKSNYKWIVDELVPHERH